MASYLTKRFLAARFCTLTGAQDEGPVKTDAPVYLPIHDSLKIEFPADDCGDQIGLPVLIEVSLSLTNLWHNGIPLSGTEFAILINNNERLRGQSSIAADGQITPFTLQGFVENVTAPAAGQRLTIEAYWRVFGGGTSYLASRGYGAAFLRASIFAK